MSLRWLHTRHTDLLEWLGLGQEAQLEAVEHVLRRPGSKIVPEAAADLPLA
jgi:hypothetical protein